MFTPHTYPAALFLMMLSMLCWGSWANTQKFLFFLLGLTSIALASIVK